MYDAERHDAMNVVVYNKCLCAHARGERAAAGRGVREGGRRSMHPEGHTTTSHHTHIKCTVLCEVVARTKRIYQPTPIYTSTSKSRSAITKGQTSIINTNTNTTKLLKT